MGLMTAEEVKFDNNNLEREFSRTDKVVLFRHTDLDGVGTEIVGHTFFDDLYVIPCENWTVNDNIRAFIEGGEYIHYDHIIVADLSFDKEIADIILANDNLTKRFMLVDHHKTALWLNDYPFSIVEVNRHGNTASATSSLYEILTNYSLVPNTTTIEGLEAFVEKVRRYDTWEWQTRYDDNGAKLLNSLLYKLGYKEFIPNILGKLTFKYHSFQEGNWVQLLDYNERYMLGLFERQTEQYIDSKIKKAKYGTYNDAIFAYVIAESDISELGNAMCERLDVEFAVILDLSRDKVSLRSKGYDVSEIAKRLGGGGHSKASGFSLGLKWQTFVNMALSGDIKSFNETKSKKTIKQKFSNLIDKFKK